MILVKIEGVMGDVTLEKYENWFVATSFSFPIGESRKQSAAGGGDQKSPAPKENNLGLVDGEYLELTINKESDAASVYLMQLAMISRAGLVDKYLKVDIHVMEQKVQGKESSNTTRPYLVIRLENAIVSGWSLSGDENGRATEDLTLWYDRAAMKFITYLSKESKDVKQVHGPLGWSLEDGEPWSCADLAKDK